MENFQQPKLEPVYKKPCKDMQQSLEDKIYSKKDAKKYMIYHNNTKI